jgi:hypothetical protein
MKQAYNNINMNVKEIHYEGVYWFHVAHERFHWPTLVNTAMNLRISKHTGKLLHRWVTISLSTITLLYGFTCMLLICILERHQYVGLLQKITVSWLYKGWASLLRMAVVGWSIIPYSFHQNRWYNFIVTKEMHLCKIHSALRNVSYTEIPVQAVRYRVIQSSSTIMKKTVVEIIWNRTCK